MQESNISSLSANIFSVNRFGQDTLSGSELAKQRFLGDEDISYRMLKSGADIPRELIEIDAPGCGIQIKWGSNCIESFQFNPPRDFILGDAIVGDVRGEKYNRLMIPQKYLASSRMPIVLVEDGELFLALHEGVVGFVETPMKGSLSLNEGREIGIDSSRFPGVKLLALPIGSRAQIVLGEFKVEISSHRAGRVVPALGPFAERLQSGLVLSALSTLGVVSTLFGALYYFTPNYDDANAFSLDEDRLYAIQQYLSASAAREEEAKELSANENDSADALSDATENSSAEKTKSDRVESSPQLKTKEPGESAGSGSGSARAQASEFGMISLLKSMVVDGGSERLFASEAAISDSALGMWGRDIGEGSGVGTLGAGIGSGGPGIGFGIDGVGGFGELGNSFGSTSGDRGDIGGKGRPSGTHQGKPPSIRMASGTTVSGRMPQEVIQRIVRQNYGRFRMCYESGLRNNPNLSGRVNVRFAIGRDGSVSSANGSGSDLPDNSVVDCVVRAYYNLSFPAPSGGIVTVVYPINFSPA